MKNHGALILKMNRWNRKDTAEIFADGFTRFISDGAEVPMTAMDNLNPLFAQHYLEFRGWAVSERMEVRS